MTGLLGLLRHGCGAVLVLAAAAASVALLGSVNAPLRLAGPMNLPNIPLIMMMAATAILIVPGAVLARWTRRGYGWLLLAMGAGIAVRGALNQLGGSPDGGQWGDRHAPAEPVYNLLVYGCAAVIAGIGAILSRAVVTAPRARRR